MVYRGLAPSCPCTLRPQGLGAWGNSLQVCSFFLQTHGPVCCPCSRPESEPWRGWELCGPRGRVFASSMS